MSTMSRREVLAMAAVGALLRKVAGAQQAVPSNIYRDYSRCLPDYLRDLAERAYQSRNRAISLLTTPAAVQERQRWVTETFWTLVGGMPERTPLNARTVGTFERPGYRVEKVVYESQPNFHISGTLYIPTVGSPPFPGVLYQMGHTLNGKGDATYQLCCQTLAGLGYLVLGFDPMGQGERTYYPGPVPSHSRLGADEEHTFPGRQMLLKGITSTRLQTWDSVRSLDYLASHPLVDPKRLASTGQSGGGTTTMLLSAVDNRLAAAVVSCGNTENVACADFIPPGSTDDGEQNLVGSAPVGFDRWDLLYPIAPKPLLVMVSQRDFFGTYSPNYLTSGIEEFRKLQNVYRTLGHLDRIGWFGTPLPHGFSYDLRMQMYNWFARWLKGESKPVAEEPVVQAEAEETLFVSANGSVVQSFHGETPFTLNRARKLSKTPVDLAKLLSVDPPVPGLGPVTVGHASYHQTLVDAVEFPSAPKVCVPAWLYQPKASDRSKPLVIVLEPGGRNAWHESGIYNRMAAGGCIVCAPDLRGIGDMTPEFGRGAARHARPHNSEEDYAWSALVLGKPLTGQRVTDILAVVRGLRARPEFAQRSVILAARGVLTVPAQFAAALEPAIGSLYLADGLISFRSIVETEVYNYPFGNFVPNLLAHTDLPELTASFGPRRATLAGTVDGAGNRLAADAVWAEFSGATNIRILPDPAWSPSDILSA
ncbi:MAG TPA: acetylxylan esterase [Acidobacteriota bacterium]|nr:acetylxylan esterase [Acidobacteriota bacterium]